PELPPESEPVADQNVERLIQHCYRPESPDPEFVRRVERRLLAIARQNQRADASAGPTWLRRPAVRLLLATAAVAAAVLAAVMLWPAPAPRRPAPPAVAGRPADRLTPRPRKDPPPPPVLAVRDTVATKADERKRVAGPDGSVLYLNAGTQVTLAGERRLSLTRGDLFIEVAPRGPKSPFVVETADREVMATGAKFEVSAFPKLSNV